MILTDSNSIVQCLSVGEIKLSLYSILIIGAISIAAIWLYVRFVILDGLKGEYPVWQKVI